MLFNRCIRSGLPVTSDTLRPVVISAHENLLERQIKQKGYYDRMTKPLPTLKPGTPVYVRTDEERQWQPAKVLGTHEYPRSYAVDNGRNVVRRNRVHLKPDNLLNDQSDNQVMDDLPTATQDMAPPKPDDTMAGCSPATDSPPGAVSPYMARTPRVSRGVLPVKYRDYIMN